MRAGHFCLWRYTPKPARPPLFATSQTVRVSPSPTSSKFFLPSKVLALCVPNAALVADMSLQRPPQIFVSQRSFLPLMAPSRSATSVSPIKTVHVTTKVNVCFLLSGMSQVSTCVSTLMRTHLSPLQLLLRALALGQRLILTITTNGERGSLVDCSH